MDELGELLAAHAVVHRAPIMNTYDRPLRGLSGLARGRGACIAPLVRRLAPDVVHLNKQNVEDGLDLLDELEAAGVPAVCTVHVTRTMRELGSRGGRLRDWVSRRALRSTRTRVIAISDACSEQLRAFAGSARERVACVPNGVSPAPAIGAQRYRDEWQIGGGDVVCGCVARIEAQKNPLFLPRIWGRLPGAARLVWVGDGRLRGEFEQAAASAGITDRIRVDGWRRDARERMGAFDVFLLPSAYEGLPLALLEAMSAGLACVASDVDGIADAIEDGVTGRLCRAGDEEQWVRVLSELIANPDERARLGAAARRRWQERFSLESMARGTVAVYREAIAQHSAGACCRGIA
jgi:glycosyltransferase involved in cell wall biosynthesis